MLETLLKFNLLRNDMSVSKVLLYINGKRLYTTSSKFSDVYFSNTMLKLS